MTLTADAALLLANMKRLEDHYRDLCDIEFTIERGKLFINPGLERSQSATALKDQNHMIGKRHGRLGVAQ